MLSIPGEIHSSDQQSIYPGASNEVQNDRRNDWIPQSQQSSRKLFLSQLDARDRIRGGRQNDSKRYDLFLQVPPTLIVCWSSDHGADHGLKRCVAASLEIMHVPCELWTGGSSARPGWKMQTGLR